MSSVKRQKDTERARRYDTVVRLLSPFSKPLTVPQLVDLLKQAGHQIQAETPKKWRERGIPERWARRIASLPQARKLRLTASWIADGSPPAPEGADQPLGAIVVSDQFGVDRRVTGPSQTSAPDAGSGPVRALLSDEIGAVSTVARRIAETVRVTIERDEMGYTAQSRRRLAQALATFARDLDEQCGYTVAGDIWKVVDWLREEPSP